MEKEAKILIGLGIATVAVLIGGSLLMSRPTSQQSTETKTYEESLLVGENPHVEGAAEPKVTIVEFGDFQCPACSASHPITKQVLGQYGDSVKFVFRHFPLEMHDHAFDAARAAEAAGAQGKFWEMHDKLYENQEDWAEKDDYLAKFEVYAKDIGLNLDEYKKAMADKPYDPIISKGLTDGTAAGVNATPTFFINGQKMAGVFTFDEWKKLLDKVLAENK